MKYLLNSLQYLHLILRKMSFSAEKKSMSMTAMHILLKTSALYCLTDNIKSKFCDLSGKQFVSRFSMFDNGVTSFDIAKSKWKVYRGRGC